MSFLLIGIIFSDIKSPSYACSVACFIPKILKPTIENIQKTIKTIFAVIPIDFKLVMINFKPKIKNAKAGIPTIRKTNSTISQKGKKSTKTMDE